MAAGSGEEERSGTGGGPGLAFRWLGGRETLVGGTAVHLESAKTEALLAWILLNPGPHARSRLKALLWPDFSEERASAGLRRALWDLKRKLAPDGGPFVLRVSRGEVEIDPGPAFDLDVRAFLEVAGRSGRTGAGGRDARWAEEAVTLYRGELLAGLAVEDAPAFEEWLLGERESLRLLGLAALRSLVAFHRERGEWARALAHARRLLALDPWLEEGHRDVAELLALTGRRGAAIRQLEACRRVLADELGAAPSRETVALERKLRGEPASDGEPRPAAGPAFAGPRNNLPIASAPFVGRGPELASVERHLTDPECRLLTLLGPGGSGKTRLAVQAASRLSGSRPGLFADGVVFVPPRGEAGASGLAEALARSLELEGGGRDDPAGRLLGALADARLLLVLDAFETRLDEVPLLSRLLAGACEVKALVSSRERLGLPEEWVLSVGGLETPVAGAPPDPARCESLRLFLSAARRARVGFDPGPADLAAAAEICRAVGGLPLAVEVAAGWVHALSPGEVAAQLARGPELLAGGRRGGRGGAGLRKVFDEAVARLDAEERSVLLALSVFSGGMTWEAASEVGPASPEVLRSLADRSFLRLEASSGRYSLHEVLRAFAAEALRGTPHEEAAARGRHAVHYARFLARIASALGDRTDREARDALATELGNVRAAWTYSAAVGDAAFLSAALRPLAAAHLSWGSWAEAERLAGEAVAAGAGAQGLVTRAAFRLRLGDVEAAEADVAAALSRLGPGEDALRAEALLHGGHAALLRGRFAEARDGLLACISVAREQGQDRVLAEALGRLGRAVLDAGRHEEARPLFEESLQVARALGSRLGVASATTQLGLADYFAGELDEARRRLREALVLARAEGSRPAVAAALRGLGFVAEDRGESEEAAAVYRESLATCRENGDRYAAARSLMLLGEVERRRGAGDAARTYYEEALVLSRAVGSSYLAGLLEGNLAYLAAAEGRGREALAHARTALAISRETGSDTVGLPALVALAEVAVSKRDAGLALELLGCVLSHPGNRQDHQLEVDRVVERLRRELPRVNVDGGLVAGRRRRFDELAAEAFPRLERPRGRARR